MHPSLCNLSLVSQHLTTSKQTPVQARTRTSWRATQRCAMCTQLSVYDYLKDSFPPSASAGVPPRRVDLVGLYRSWTLLSARPTNFPPTHSLSVVTLCTPHSTAHHPIALRDELDRLPILFNSSFVLLYSSTLLYKVLSSFPSPIYLRSVSSIPCPSSLPRVKSTIILPPFQPFRSVSSVLHHLPSPHTTVVSSPHEPEGLLIVTRIPYCPTLRSSIPINPILSERHLHSGPLAILCESARSRAHRRQPQLPEWLRSIHPAASCGEMMCAGQRSGDPSPVIESFHVTR